MKIDLAHDLLPGDKLRRKCECLDYVVGDIYTFKCYGEKDYINFGEGHDHFGIHVEEFTSWTSSWSEGWEFVERPKIDIAKDLLPGDKILRLVNNAHLHKAGQVYTFSHYSPFRDSKVNGIIVEEFPKECTYPSPLNWRFIERPSARKVEAHEKVFHIIFNKIGHKNKSLVLDSFNSFEEAKTEALKLANANKEYSYSVVEVLCTTSIECKAVIK